MKLDFYYFSSQCPLNSDMVILLDKYKDKIDINAYDISNNADLTQKLHIFYPTLTIINDQYRFYSPIRKTFLDRLVNGQIPEELPYRPQIGRKMVSKIVEPLTLTNLATACNCCGSKTDLNCLRKRNFLMNTGLPVYGYIHKDEFDALLGGVEYLPSKLVPYAIPKGDDIAFITCAYLTDPDSDYKSSPLKSLESYLRDKYSTIVAITDELGIFPNGDLPFFLNNGYTDNGIVYEDRDYCTLHLVSKRLSE